MLEADFSKRIAKVFLKNETLLTLGNTGLQSFPGSFLMSQFFASGGQSIGDSASVSVLPMNIQD